MSKLWCNKKNQACKANEVTLTRLIALNSWAIKAFVSILTTTHVSHRINWSSIP
jgi:hypothetical protein